MRIGVFDSGVGGVTVLKELISTHPFHEYIYYGDTAHMPYGEKSKEQLYQYVQNIIDFFITQKVELILIACGTVSTNIYKELTEQYQIPIVDIITPTISFLKGQSYQSIGVLATSMTIQSGIFESSLDGISVTSIACPKLVPLIEKGNKDTEECHNVLVEYLKPMKENQIGAIIMGCTHYPVLMNQMKDIYDTTYINMGTCLVETVAMTDTSTFDLKFYFSALDENVIANINQLISVPYEIEELKFTSEMEA